MGEFLQCDICYYINIIDFLPEQASLYEYIQKVIAYIVITGKGRSGPDI